MRINIYTEELADATTPRPHAEIVTADYVSSRTGLPMTNYGLRVYLKSHPDLHFVPPRDDDRSAITFWCGSKSKNLMQFVDVLRQVVDVDNLHRFRETVAVANAEAEVAEAARNGDRGCDSAGWPDVAGTRGR
ncbi:MAG: hypothetical protein GEV06_16650 [Luteitalea sp.]|nr:hypothetical protein [Luteitalea sp.]